MDASNNMTGAIAAQILFGDKMPNAERTKGMLITKKSKTPKLKIYRFWNRDLGIFNLRFLSFLRL